MVVPKLMLLYYHPFEQAQARCGGGYLHKRNIKSIEYRCFCYQFAVLRDIILLIF